MKIEFFTTNFHYTAFLNSKSTCKGFGGRRFRITFENGDVIETTDLWEKQIVSHNYYINKIQIEEILDNGAKIVYDTEKGVAF